MTRDEYVASAKQQALAYLDQGDIKNAVTGMLADMDKREDTMVNAYLFNFGMNTILKNSRADARRFIEGFH